MSARPIDARAGETDGFVERGQAWWSFRTADRPVVPEVSSGFQIRNPIDAFVVSAQAELGLEPSPEADNLTLIRRLTLDLTGLPPTPAEVDAFLADDRPDAYERVVDRLLGSPRFGERWARFWLDVARYADSDGFELDGRRPNAWRYRDWVVQAINEDMPYDRFVRLQLAADEIEPDEPPQRAALGFLRCGPSVANQKNERTRLDELDDIVSTTGAAFLGLTIGCARCHDHKTDPIPTEDYYRLLAVFSPARFADVSLATRKQIAAHRVANRSTDVLLQELRGALNALNREARRRVEQSRLAALPAKLRKAYETGDLSHLDANEQSQLIRGTKVTSADVEMDLSASELAGQAELRARIDCIEEQRDGLLPEAPGVVETGAEVEPVFVLVRGDPDRKGQVVQAGPPRAIARGTPGFHDRPSGASTSGRRAMLAGWITDPSNPLTARVAINRIWQGHFGKGLVETASDFGAAGSPPILPDLLDWLACELVARDWHPKAIHRLIVTSAIYRQSSRVRAEAREVDPEEVLFWRFPPRRLEAEAVRDQILWCAGSLNMAMGGPGGFPPMDPGVVRTGNQLRWPLDVKDGPDVWRRSLYIFQMRSRPLPLLENFDLPDSMQSCPSRNRTTTPNQALSLLNDPFLIHQARLFAARVAREAGPGQEDRVILAFRIATGRPPGRRLLDSLRVDLRERAARYRSLQPDDSLPPDIAALGDLAQVLFGSHAFLYLD